MKAEWMGIIAAWISAGAAIVMARIALSQIKYLKRTRKRQESPFFELGSLQILRPGFPGSQGFDWPDGDGDVPEDYPDGSPVRLAISNKGSEARNTEAISLTDLSIQVGDSKRIVGEKSLEIYYPYCRTRRGKPEQFRISYETISGETGQQVFEHPHGQHTFKRVEIT